MSYRDINKFEQNIGEVIQKLRIESGFTQEELAYELCMSSRSLRRIESGSINKLDSLCYIAEFFNMDLFDLLSLAKSSLN